MSLPPSLDERLTKALAHPLRWRILEILVERGETSPIELSRLLDESLATVSHHIRVLRESASIELTRTEPRRGAVEHYYRAIVPAFLDEEHWRQVPTVLRRGLAGQVFHRLFAEAADAAAAGAFDAPASHLDRMIVELDDQGWDELSKLLRDALRGAQAIQERSDARRTDIRRVRSVEVGILSFERAESLAADAGVEPPRRSPPLPP
jgi:DNA-binding transcriptional ArsR family regulator